MIDLAVLKVIYRFKIASAVPLDTPISYTDLATRVNLPVIRLRSLLRQSALNGIFAETADEDKVEHTRLSRILVHNTTLNDWVGHCVEDCLPACDRLADALEQYSDSHAPEDSAFSLAFGIREPMFSFVEKDPERQRRMFGAMQGISNAPGHSFDHIVEGYPWKQFKDADVVDVSCVFLCKFATASCQLLNVLLIDDGSSPTGRRINRFSECLSRKSLPRNGQLHRPRLGRHHQARRSTADSRAAPSYQFRSP